MKAKMTKGPLAPMMRVLRGLGLALLPVLCGSAWALTVDGGSPASPGSQGRFAFQVVNDGTQPLRDLAWHASKGYTIACATQTVRGAAFQTAGGTLQAGDRLACEARPDGRRRQGMLAVRAQRGDGPTLVKSTRFDIRGALSPDQGVVAVLTGSIHDDGNGDGNLDAGEGVDYHYTVLNLGNQDLSGLALADLAGPVGCPAAVLAVGAHMICQRSYTITAADDDAGEIINAVEVQGVAANGDPVQAVDLDLRLDLGGDADINVIKSPLLADDADASGYASEGDLIEYTFVVKNTDAQALDALDLIEPDPTLIDGPIACEAQTLGGAPFVGLGTGELASMDALRCTAPRTITPAEAAAGQVTNRVDAHGQPAIGAPAFATGVSLVLVPTGAQVTIAKALSGESGSQAGVAEPGETLTYTITLSNAGGADALDYGVTDLLDPNTSFVSADNGGSHVGGVVTWSGLTVPGNGTLVLTVQVTVADPLPVGTTFVANLVHETGTTPPDCPPAGAQCVIIPTPGTVDLEKSVADGNGNGIAEPGETLTYTITLSNNGGSDAAGIDLTDPLDGNTTFASASHGGSHAAGVVTWSNLTVPAGGDLVLTLVVTVNDPLPMGVTRIGNLVHDSGGSPPDCRIVPTPANCTSLPTGPAVTVAKSVADGNGDGQAEPGETLTYTITLSNTGGSAATAYGVTDTLDPNTAFVSASHGGSHAAGVVTWSGLTVPAQVGATPGTLVLTLVVTVNDPLPDDVGLIANLVYQTGTTPPDCPATPTPPGCATIPVGLPQVAVSKTANVSQSQPNGAVVYTIVVANVGTVAVTSLTISDPIPAGVASFNWTCAGSGGGVCADISGTGAINQLIASFPVGGVLTYTVTAQLTANPPSQILNVVSVTPGETVICQPEGTPSPCQADVPVTVVSGTPGGAAPVPLDNPWALLALLMALLAAAGHALRRQRLA